ADKVYGAFAEEVRKLIIIFQTYFEKIFHNEKIIQLPVKSIGLESVHCDSISLRKRRGFQEEIVVAAGIVDGRNMWREDLKEKLTELDTIKQIVHDDQLIIQPSYSLLHVPVTKRLEEKLDAIILGGLSFADEKISEIVTLTKGAQEGR